MLDTKIFGHTYYTHLVAHLGNKGRLPGNDVGDPQRGSELIGDFSVDGWSGFGTLIGEHRCEELASPRGATTQNVS